MTYILSELHEIPEYRGDLQSYNSIQTMRQNDKDPSNLFVIPFTKKKKNVDVISQSNRVAMKQNKVKTTDQ
jgi:hypothetical protein